MGGPGPLPSGGNLPDISPYDNLLGQTPAFRLAAPLFRHSGFQYELLDGKKVPQLTIQPLSVGYWGLTNASGFPVHSSGAYRVVGPAGRDLGTLSRDVLMTDLSGNPVPNFPLSPRAGWSDPPRGLRHSVSTFLSLTGQPLLVTRTAVGFPVSPHYPLTDEGLTFPAGTLVSRVTPPSISSVLVTHALGLLDGSGRPVLQAKHDGFAGMTYDISMVSRASPFPHIIHLVSVLLEVKAVMAIGTGVYMGAVVNQQGGYSIGGTGALSCAVVQDTQPVA